jgi:hypothetical protein
MRGEDLSDLPPLPSLDTIVRYRARLDRDYHKALKELEVLQSLRPDVEDEPAATPSGKHEPEPPAPRGPVLVTSRPALVPPPAPAHPAPTAGAASVPSLNRHQRRALAAMERKSGGHGRAR